MNFPSRQVEFIFSQTAPAVCLPCKQTDFTKRIIALFRVLLYRLSSKKLLKIENTSSNQFELEFTFSFDLRKKTSIFRPFFDRLFKNRIIFSSPLPNMLTAGTRSHTFKA